MRFVALAADGNASLLLALVIASAFAVVAPLIPARAQPQGLPVLSLLAAGAYFRAHTVGFLLDLGVAYAVVRWLGARRDVALRWRVACLLMVVVAAVFTAGRVVQASPFLFAVNMWLLLRLITLLWEVGSGAVCTPPVGAYITWACLPLTLVGPLLRYSEFRPTPADSAPPRRWLGEAAIALVKLGAGISLAAGDLALAESLPGGRVAAGAVRVLLTGPIGFYLTLAGYFHAMQALGMRAGIPLPDSFNWPIGRRNIGEFWAGWNMTATRVFRDYLFYNRWGRGTYNIFLNTFLLFTLMGLWHGANAYWVIFGMLHGALFCGFLVWRRYRGRLERLPLRGTMAAGLAARAFTYLAVCACWYLPTKIVIQLARL